MEFDNERFPFIEKQDEAVTPDAGEELTPLTWFHVTVRGGRTEAERGSFSTGAAQVERQHHGMAWPSSEGYGGFWLVETKG